MRLEMKAILAALAFLAAGALAPPVHAQAVCGDRSRIMATLAENYAERPVAIALTSEGAVIEVLTSPVGTWSILVTAPGGPTCLVAGGENWQPVPVVQPRGSPAYAKPALASPEAPPRRGLRSRLREARSCLGEAGASLRRRQVGGRREVGEGRPARFQPIAHLGCLSLDEVLDKLLKRWGETLAGIGKSSDRFGRDLTVFFTTSPEGAYSMFAVRDGCAYFVSGGEAWQWLREGAK